MIGRIAVSSSKCLSIVLSGRLRHRCLLVLFWPVAVVICWFVAVGSGLLEVIVAGVFVFLMVGGMILMNVDDVS